MIAFLTSATRLFLTSATSLMWHPFVIFYSKADAFVMFMIDISELFVYPSLFFGFRIETIDKCFSHDTVEEIIDALVGFLDYFFVFLTIYTA